VRRWLTVLAMLSLLSCGDDRSGSEDAQGANDAKGSATTGTFEPTRATEAIVDRTLAERTIVVPGPAEVGRPLVAHISPDIAGRIDSWHWHRCIEIPACGTIRSATGPAYTPNPDDAWQVLRIISVVDGKAVEARVGPVVNARPRPFDTQMTLNPSNNDARVLIIGPGVLQVRVHADCPVDLIGGVKQASTGDDHEQTLLPRREGSRFDLEIDTPGGQLTLAVTGTCDRATFSIAGQR
jgi:hypothetical protein